MQIAANQQVYGRYASSLRRLAALWAGVAGLAVAAMIVVTCVDVVSGMERDVPLETIFRGSMPFLVAMIVVAILLILFPDIALIPPRWIHP